MEPSFSRNGLKSFALAFVERLLNKGHGIPITARSSLAVALLHILFISIFGARSVLAQARMLLLADTAEATLHIIGHVPKEVLPLQVDWNSNLSRLAGSPSQAALVVLSTPSVQLLVLLGAELQRKLAGHLFRDLLSQLCEDMGPRNDENPTTLPHTVSYYTPRQGSQHRQECQLLRTLPKAKT